MGHSQIVSELHLDPKTVRKFMRAATAEEPIGAGPSGAECIQLPDSS
ncbi:hypothetical protein [Kitasatospora kifunensis]|uniref:Uncharacterized protein n=1 Tax=Kitasatospora kifunensis TaxID=58351 RepID=A0A7W7VTC7_KITKI|nr:hypothetical protein [Kitasatospora kifunensis]MBB4922092.1 hypothetical protein [Kitasatospora kifunensis]